MSERDLLSILGDLTDEAFDEFKWHLKLEKVGDIEPIQVRDLSKAERRNVVDLMVEKYEVDGAVQVTMSVLKKINRNDLVTKLGRKVSGAEGVGPGGARGPPAGDRVPAGDQVPADKRLSSVRLQFISRVSGPVLNQLLDKLLEDQVINYGEMQSIVETNASKADQARDMIDMVRGKGAPASSALIAALCEMDQFLSKELKLI